MPDPGIAAPDPTSPEAKRRDLRRMRFIASALLVAMTVIFVATTITTLTWPWLPYLRAFAEAGMVGACADWFAVVALFRHPFGIPIPHTGIVPNNKARIGAALGRFLTNNFLNPRIAHRHLRRVDIAGFLTQWINQPAKAQRIARFVGRALPQTLKSVRGPELGAFLGRVVRRGIEAVPAAPLASRLLAMIWAGGAARGVIERALELGEQALSRNRPEIHRIVSEQSSRWIPNWVDVVIADRVMSGLLSTLHAMRNPAHPWRLELAQNVEHWIEDLARDPETRVLGEKLKGEVLSHPLLAEQAKVLWMDLEGLLQADAQGYSEAVTELLEHALRGLGHWLEENPAQQRLLNRRIRLVLLRVLLPRRAEIGAYVTQVVQNWDNATLVNRLELQLGKDLQYVRINGTLVGGLVGLLIFVASQWLSR